MSRSAIRTTEYMLTQWGLWAYHNRGLSLYFPSIEPFAKMTPRSAQGLVITDAEGEAIDRIVSRLRKSSESEHDAIARYYVASQSYRDIAKAHGHKDHKRVSALVTNGKRFIDGIFDMADEDVVAPF